MTKADIIFLQILKAALADRQFEPENKISQEEWTEIFRLAEIHNVLPLVSQAVFNQQQFKEWPNLRSKVRQLMMVQMIKTEEFMQLYKILSDNGLKPVVVKGIICRSLYPNPDLRLSSDEDILVLEEDFEEYHRILEQFGMIQPYEQEQAKKEFEVPYHKNNSALYIELHKSLFSPCADAYGDWNRFFVNAQKDAVEINGICSLSHTDHLFYLICHAFKHFMHSGFGIRQICDIVMYANTYGDRVKWDTVFKNCCEINAEYFAASLFKIGEKYLVFDREKAAYPYYWQQIEIDETDMLQDLLGGGVFGSSTMSRKHSSNITLDAITSSKKGKKSNIQLKNTLFPSSKYLSGRYPYLLKYPYLLPVAWVDRWSKYNKERNKVSDNSAIEAIRIGSNRVELMRKYKVIK